jgi:hypothetical protein
MPYNQKTEVKMDELNTVNITQAEFEEYQKLRETPDYREKYTALTHGIAPELTDDALTLAKLRVNEECDLDSALDAVLTTYPHMKAGYVQANTPLSTGIKTGGKPAAVSGVEAAFLKKNPGIKL